MPTTENKDSLSELGYKCFLTAIRRSRDRMDTFPLWKPEAFTKVLEVFTPNGHVQESWLKQFQRDLGMGYRAMVADALDANLYEGDRTGTFVIIKVMRNGRHFHFLLRTHVPHMEPLRLGTFFPSL